MTVTNRRAKRLEQLPPYLFIEIDRAKEEAIAAGRDVIDFGVGDPDLPTMRFIVDRMAEAIRDPKNHPYSLGRGTLAFRRAAAAFFQRRFGVELDPATEVLALLGSKEGIGHLPLAAVNPGDVVLTPEPGYPVYVCSAVFAGATCHVMPLEADNGFLPVLEDIPAHVRQAASLMWLNYPNNPTSACAPLSFCEEAVAFAREHGILIAQDAAYSELYFGPPSPSFLQVDGAKDVCVEFHSLSKTYNMTGWRIGFAVGGADTVSALAAVKGNLDSGVFGAVQEAACAALDNSDHVEVRAMLDIYRRRRDVLADGLTRLNWKANRPDATFYLWVPCPQGYDSMTTAKRILDEADVVVVPGVGFGRCGEGFVRFALAVDEGRIREALDRLGRIEW